MILRLFIRKMEGGAEPNGHVTVDGIAGRFGNRMDVAVHIEFERKPLGAHVDFESATHH